MQNGTKASILVSVQLVCFVGILLSGNLLAKQLWLLAIQVFGLLFAFWSIWSIRPNRLSVSPLVQDELILIKRGPYKFIRHPMYLSIFIVFVPLLIDEFSYLRLAILIVLFINQVIKLHFEESLLSERFPEYQEYKKKSWRLLPLIF